MQERKFRVGPGLPPRTMLLRSAQRPAAMPGGIVDFDSCPQKPPGGKLDVISAGWIRQEAQPWSIADEFQLLIICHFDQVADRSCTFHPNGKVHRCRGKH